MKKYIVILLLAGLILGTIGFAASSNVTVNGFQKGKHIGVVGLLNVKDRTGGWCTDAYNYRTDPQTYKETLNTKNIRNGNSVKELIVDFYNSHLSAVGARNIQLAIWYFTNNIKSSNPNVQRMINYVKTHHQVIPDKYLQYISSTTKLKSTSTSTTFALIGSDSTITNETTSLGNKTNSTTIKNCKCTTIVTTITKYFQTITQNNTINTYLKTVTTTRIYTLIKKYTQWTFTTWKGSKVKGKKQKLVFFKKKVITKTTTITKPTISKTTVQNSTSTNTTSNFNTTATTSKTICCPVTPCIPKPPCKPVCKTTCKK
jgi:hypothetical protein